MDEQLQIRYKQKNNTKIQSDVSMSSFEMSTVSNYSLLNFEYVTYVVEAPS
jgi:hypothetical protein